MVFYLLFGVIMIGYIGYVLGKQETRNIEQRIAKARDLRDRNVITEEEYQSVRRKIVLDA